MNPRQSNENRHALQGFKASTWASYSARLVAMASPGGNIVAGVGEGTTMPLHCDLVYAGGNAVFSLSFANLGLCPEAASSLLAPQLVGYHRAAEVLLLGEPFKADAALTMGLVNRVAPSADVNGLAQTPARKRAA